MISVAGKPIKTIDVHAHCVIPEALQLMGQKLSPVYAHSYDDRIKRMDEMGIDVQAISTSPSQYYYRIEPELGRKTSRIINERLAEIVALHPDRFVALATLPNVAEFVLLYFALQKIGAIPIAALVSHRFAEINQFVQLSGAVACFYP